MNSSHTSIDWRAALACIPVVVVLTCIAFAYRFPFPLVLATLLLGGYLAGYLFRRIARRKYYVRTEPEPERIRLSGVSSVAEANDEYLGGIRLRDAGEYRVAASKFRTASILDTHFWKARYNHAFCLLQVQDLNPALDEFISLRVALLDRGVARTPDESRLLSRCFLQIAYVYYARTDYLHAWTNLQMLEDLIDANLLPNDVAPTLLVNMISVAVRLEREDLAHLIYDQIQSLEPSIILKEEIGSEELQLLARYRWFRIPRGRSASTGKSGTIADPEAT